MQETRGRHFVRVGVPTLISCALVAPASFSPIHQLDVGWHLAQGRLIAARGLFSTNSLTWTFPDFPWYPTSWLYDLTAFHVIDRFGVIGLQLITFLFVATALAAIALASARIWRLGAWLTLLSALLTAPHVTERPHVAMWGIMTGVFALCVGAEERDWRYRTTCIPLLLLGSNLHSSVIISSGICAAFCAQAWWRNRAWQEWAVAGAAMMCIFANPGGTYDVMHLAENWQLKGVLRIDEMQQASLERLTHFFVLAPLVITAAITQARRRPALLPIVAALGVLTLHAGRFVREFDLLIAPVLAGGFAALPTRLALSARVVACIAPLLVLPWRWQFLVSDWSARFDPDVLPVRGVDYLQSRGITGRGFCGAEQGGYLEWTLPALPAFQDGRIFAFPQDFFAEEAAAEQNPEDFDAWLAFRHVEWAMTGRERGHSDEGAVMDTGDDWALVYWDDVVQIFLRRSVPQFAPVIENDEYRLLNPKRRWLPLVKTLDAGGLTELWRELDRHDAEAGHGDRRTAVARCAAAVRLKAPRMERYCAEAERLETTAAGRESVREARAMPPLETNPR